MLDLFLPGDLVRLEHGSLERLGPLWSRAGLVLMVSFTHTHLRLPNLTPVDLKALKVASDRLCLVLWPSGQLWIVARAKLVSMSRRKQG